MWLLVAFIAIPLIEIGLFIQIGGWIGVGPTLGLVFLSALAGLWLMRMQGARALAQLRGSLNELGDPTEPIAHGALTLLAGVLLLVPGFFTDALGLLLLIRPVRTAILRHLAARVQIAQFTAGGRSPRHQPRQPDVIDGEFHEIGADGRPGRPSGWTRH